MKVFAIALFFTVLVTGCYSGDDYNQTIIVRAENSVRFENQKNYVVGDTLFFEIEFSRYLEEDGFTTLLDVYETTEATAFSFSFGLLKFSDFSNTYEFINVDSELVLGPRPDDSSSNGFYGNQLVAVLDVTTQEQYYSRIGLILVETGDYQLDLDFLSFNPPYDPNKVQLRIENVVTNDTSLDVGFTVAEE